MLLAVACEHSHSSISITTIRHKLSIYCTQLVPLTRANTYRNVASRLLAGLVTVEQARTAASFARKRDARYRAARKRFARDRDPTAV